MQTGSSRIPLDGSGFRVGVLLSRFNDILGAQLYTNFSEELIRLGVLESDIFLFRVPGSLEFPFAAQRVIRTQKIDVLVVLGVVIRGKTSHYNIVCNESHRGLMDVSLLLDFPIIFGILAVEDELQARERVSALGMNKGSELARSAVEMADFHRQYL